MKSLGKIKKITNGWWCLRKCKYRQATFFWNMYSNKLYTRAWFFSKLTYTSTNMPPAIRESNWRTNNTQQCLFAWTSIHIYLPLYTSCAVILQCVTLTWYSGASAVVFFTFRGLSTRTLILPIKKKSVVMKLIKFVFDVFFDDIFC